MAGFISRIGGKMIRVNRCGKTEDKFVNGWCKECNSTCEMNEEQMIDKRVYDYAMRHGLLACGMFSISNFKTYFENHPCIEKEPKYIQNYLKTIEVES